MGLIPAGSYANKQHIGDKVFNKAKIGRFADDLAFDPQTSGGLLISIPAEYEISLLEELHKGGFVGAVTIGRFVEGDGTLTLL